MDGKIILRGALACLILCLALPATAQWTTQAVTLRPGWNAVFLEVQPAPNATAEAFAGLPVESVWAWNKSFNTVQYIQDPNTLVPQQPEWLKFFPAGTPDAFLSNLLALTGGRTYLIKLAGRAEVQCTVTGQPVYRPGEWQTDSFNLKGFYVADGNAMTFQTYFSESPEHAGQKMLKLNANGAWTELDPAQEVIRRGEAYWIWCQGESTYRGPVSVEVQASSRLDYGRSLSELDLTLANHSSSTRTFTLTPRNSAPPPVTDEPLLAGNVPLAWYHLELASNIVEWAPISGATTFEVPAGADLIVRVGVRRTDFAEFAPPSVDADFLYQSILNITDGTGISLDLPVTAEGLQVIRPEALEAKNGEKQTLEEMFGDPHAGLWYGYVSVSKVSEPRNASEGPVAPLPTASEFVFPILLHVDYDGNTHLLQHATVMWKDGTTQPAEENPQFQETAEPGRYVVVANDALLAQFQGSAVRDGAQVGRRFASANFSNPQPLIMGGEFGGNLALDLTIEHDDPLNPFKHRYHPDHNQAIAIPTTRADGSASNWYTVTREIDIEFTDTDPESIETTRWGDQLMGGYYREALIGVHKSVLYTEGFIRLTRVLNVGVLNDGIE